jgi:DNA-directed RNA polymerase omega subunit
VDDFRDKFDSLYRLVIVTAKRANQVTKHQSHGFGAAARSRKPTITALEEVIDGKLTFTTAEDEVYFAEDEASED